MSILAPSGSPLPTINAVMNVARSRVGDMLDSVDGTLLTNDAAFSQTYLSAAWAWYQERCANAGIELQIRETTLTGFPARATDDVTLQCFITWNGCGDGVSEYDGPALPQDLVNPLSVWRRQSGQATNLLQLMTQAKDGLPRYLDTNVYDWRENGFYFYGTYYPQDFLFRYSTYWADLDLTQPQSQIPMRGCEDCLGARVAFEYASSRGSAQASVMENWANTAFDQSAVRTSRRRQRGTFRRKRYGSSGNSGFGYGWPVL